MREPEWIDGDEFARGEVDECPICGEIALRDGVCGECGYDVASDEDDHAYDAYKDAQADFAWRNEGN